MTKQEKIYPIVIKFAEKHGDMYYLANNHEEYLAIFTEVFNRRNDEGYWYASHAMQSIPDKMEDPGEGAHPELVKTVQIFNRNVDRIIRANQLNSDANLDYELAATGDKHHILTFMSERRDYEYEMWEEIDLLTVSVNE